MDFLNYNSIETIPGYEARVAFTINSASVFKEDVDIVPTILSDRVSYVPWGGDNQMPFDILALVEKDETLATCQLFNAEVCYGSGRIPSVLYANWRKSISGGCVVIKFLRRSLMSPPFERRIDVFL